MQVQGKAPGDQYTVFPTHFCSCHAFSWDIVGRGQSIYVRCAACSGACYLLQHADLHSSRSASTSWQPAQRRLSGVALSAPYQMTSWHGC